MAPHAVESAGAVAQEVQAPMQDIPYGYCRCGCGRKTSLAPDSHAPRGYVKGEPRAFIRGHHFRRPLVERFWEKVDKDGPNGCWVWTAAKDVGGYGRIDLRGAHRVSWELEHGPIPEGLRALHRCDNPPCVNPSHLFLGTQLDNVRDMDAKGRRKSKGPRKLTDAEVEEMRRLMPEVGNYSELGRRFGVSHEQARRIVQRKART